MSVRPASWPGRPSGWPAGQTATPASATLSPWWPAGEYPHRPAQQNSYLTHRANADAGRHGWLRLTPAYSVRLVRERTAHLPPGAVVTDPFSGSGTTVLAAAEHGGVGQAVDVNPFLVWLGNAKAASYPAALLAETRALVPGLADQAAAWAARDAAGALGPEPAQHRPVVVTWFAGRAQGPAARAWIRRNCPDRPTIWSASRSAGPRSR